MPAPHVLRFTCLAACTAFALPVSAALAGASVSGAHCRVTLTKLSYDDPGADDAEFVELRVEGIAAPGAPQGDDAGPDAAPAPRSDAGLTLGACGLAAIELIDGQNGACSIYRTIPLADVTVPDDGVVVLCAADTPLAPACDVTAAGRSALKGGWLQNGPSDGVRLRGTSGAAVEIGYEPPPACFEATALRLPDESGAVDDVSVLCDGRYVLLGAADAPLRAPPTCPKPGGAADVEADAAADSPAVATPPAGSGRAAEAPTSGDAAYVPERAPTPRESPSKDDPLFRTDASVDAPPDLRRLPRPPGCALGPLPQQKAKGASVWTLLALIAAWRARAGTATRRRRPPVRSGEPLRAGSSARCGWWPPRSPSR